MKKLLFLAAVVGFTFVLVPADNAQAAGGNKVGICHYTGHTGGTFGDFVTTGSGLFCVNDGGNIIIVGRKACARHTAAATIGGTCADDNIGLLDPALVRGN